MNRRFWTIRAAPKDPEGGELLLYGLIGADDGFSWLADEVTPRKFKEELDALGNIRELRVMINSAGGDVFAGQAIHSMLKRHPANVTVYVDGLAASIASIVAMAGDRVIMPRNAMMMVHNPWTLGIGDAEEFRHLADTLDAIRESMIAAYQSKTNMERDDLMPLLNAETWLTAEEAVEKGFADEVEDAKAVAASLVRPGVVSVNGREFDLSCYRNLPSFPRLRDAAGKLTERDVERVLRDAGLSRERAKAILAVGWEPARAVAIPPHSTEKAPEEEEWEAPNLEDFTDASWEELSAAERRRIARHYVWAEQMPPESFGELKGPHHRPSKTSVGAVVWRAISSGRMHQMREARDPGVRAHLERHYHQFDRKAPWEEQAEESSGMKLFMEYQRLRANLTAGQ